MVWISWMFVAWLGCPASPTDADARVDTARQAHSGATDTGTSPTSDTGTPSVEVAGAAVVPLSEDGLHTPSMARDPDTGALYVAWGVRGTDGFTRIWLAVSTDDGATLSDPVAVSEPLHDATASWPEGPSVAVGADQLYVAYGAHELGGTPYAIYVQQAPLPPLSAGPTPADVPLPLSRATRVLQPRSYHSLNYPTLAVGPDEQAWLALVASPVYTGEVWVARESLGWAIEDVTASSPLSEPPCECCPPAFGIDPSGRVLVGWRGDIVKDIFLAEATEPTAPFTEHRRITETGVSDLICPQDGLAFVHHDGAMSVAWGDARPAAGRGFLGVEQPDGSWVHEPILTASDEVQARVGVVAGAGGLLTLWDSGWGGDAFVATPGSPAGQRVVSAGGTLRQLRAIAAPVAPLGIGVADDGAIWIVRLPAP